MNCYIMLEGTHRVVQSVCDHSLDTRLYLVNPYSPNVTFLYPMKTSENGRFSDVFRGYRNVTLGEYELISSNIH